MATDSPTRGAPPPEATFVVPSPLKGERARVRGGSSQKLSTFNIQAQWTSLVACKLACLFLLLITTSCSTTPHTQIQRPAGSVPTDALITQRGVLTVLGRQFTLNGYLSISAANGKRLVVTENFGGVLADVLIKPDGTVHVMRSSHAFKPKWIRRYIVADVECLFGNQPKTDCPGEMLGPNHFLIRRRWYKIDLQIVETKPGPQPATMFDESKAEKR